MENKKGNYEDNSESSLDDTTNDNASAFDLDDDDDAFNDVKGSIEESDAETDVDNLLAGSQDKHDDKKESTKKERSERRKKIFVWSFFLLLFALIVVAIVIGNNTTSGSEGDGDNGDNQVGVENPPPPLGLEDNTQYEAPPPVVSDNVNQAAIPIEKDDYARYNNEVVSDGLSEWAEIYELTRGGSIENDEYDYAIGNFGDTAQDTEVEELGEGETPALRELIETSTTANSIAGYAGNFPSRYEGYTNYVGDERLEDGTHNPMYSFVLREDLLFAFGHHVERLINPVYGNWWIWQHGGENATTNIESFLFEDMFTEEWWNENITESDKSNLPVFADWDHNDYGRDDLWDGIRWVGEVTNNNVTTIQTQNGTSFDIRSQMDILFTAYDDEGETLERTGTLTIVLTPNYEDDRVINYRLLISEADLVMDDE